MASAWRSSMPATCNRLTAACVSSTRLFYELQLCRRDELAWYKSAVQEKAHVGAWALVVKAAGCSRHPNRCENNRILAHRNCTSRSCSRPANYSPAACGTRITIPSSAMAWEHPLVGHARPTATARSSSTAIRGRVKNSRVRSRRATAICRAQMLRRSVRRRGICISAGTCGHPCTAARRRDRGHSRHSAGSRSTTRSRSDRTVAMWASWPTTRSIPVLDLFSRFVVGWAVSAVNDRHVTIKALSAPRYNPSSSVCCTSLF